MSEKSTVVFDLWTVCADDRRIRGEATINDLASKKPDTVLAPLYLHTGRSSSGRGSLRLGGVQGVGSQTFWCCAAVRLQHRSTWTLITRILHYSPS
jgi:hypothetical protein